MRRTLDTQKSSLLFMRNRCSIVSMITAKIVFSPQFDEDTQRVFFRIFCDSDDTILKVIWGDFSHFWLFLWNRKSAHWRDLMVWYGRSNQKVVLHSRLSTIIVLVCFIVKTPFSIINSIIVKWFISFPYFLIDAPLIHFSLLSKAAQWTPSTDFSADRIIRDF